MNTGRKLMLGQAVQSRTRNGLRDLLALGHVGRWWTEQLSCKLMMFIVVIVIVIIQYPAYCFNQPIRLSMFMVISLRPVPSLHTISLSDPIATADLSACVVGAAAPTI